MCIDIYIYRHYSRILRHFSRILSNRTSPDAKGCGLVGSPEFPTSLSACNGWAEGENLGGLEQG